MKRFLFLFLLAATAARADTYYHYEQPSYLNEWPCHSGPTSQLMTIDFATDYGSLASFAYSDGVENVTKPLTFSMSDSLIAFTADSGAWYDTFTWTPNSVKWAFGPSESDIAFSVSEDYATQWTISSAEPSTLLLLAASLAALLALYKR